MGPLEDLWRETRRTKKLPQKNILEARKKLTGFHLISLDTVLQKVKLEAKGMRLDLGGIAKGYVAQAAINKLTSLGFSSAMVNAGGDIVCSNPPPGKDGWVIGVEYPEYYEGKINGQLHLRNTAVATSGDMFKNIVLEGKRYSHIIDPKTGLGSTFNRTVTVIAPDGATADWMATACSLLEIRKAKRLIKHQKGTALLIVEKRNRGVKIFMSKRLEKYLF
jgi:thiamine biosynthesis lipoprotein